MNDVVVGVLKIFFWLFQRFCQWDGTIDLKRGLTFCILIRSETLVSDKSLRLESQRKIKWLSVPGPSALRQRVCVCVLCTPPTSWTTAIRRRARLMTGRDVWISARVWDSASGKSNNQCSIVCDVFPQSFDLASAAVGLLQTTTLLLLLLMVAGVHWQCPSIIPNGGTLTCHRVVYQWRHGGWKMFIYG